MTEPSTCRRTILLVEDDPGDQALTRRALADLSMHIDLVVVEDGEEALDYLLQRGNHSAETAPRPDLVLLDLNLPKLDGKEVLEGLEGHPEVQRIPVVALTTSKQDEDIVRSYELGVNSFITKPVDMNQFTQAIGDLGRYWFEIVQLPPRSD